MVLLILLSGLLSLPARAEILVHPESRLAATGAEVLFICKIDYAVEAHWVINRTHHMLEPHQRKQFAAQGFVVEEQMAGTITILTLRVNATTDKNDTEVYCLSSHATRSNTALLLVISDSPLSQNLSWTIEYPNSSSILLKWSPPFLWLGQAIEYFNLSVTNKKGESEHHQVNTTFGDPVVSFTVTAVHSQEILTCKELHFCISPVSRDRTVKLASYPIVSGYIPNFLNISSMDTTTSVLFKHDKTPFLKIDIRLPESICSYQDINYTIILAHNGNDTYFGPYQHHGSGIISKTVSKPYLREGQEYSFRIMIEAVNGVVESQEEFFNTHLNWSSLPDIQYVNCIKHGFHYQIVVGICSSVAILCVTIALICVVIVCTCINQRQKTSTVQDRGIPQNICNTLIPNPIYDTAGPHLYDNIQPKAEPHCIDPKLATYATVLNSSTITVADHVSIENPSSSASVIQSDLAGERAENTVKEVNLNPYFYT